jgi:hypothetical protein
MGYLVDQHVGHRERRGSLDEAGVENDAALQRSPGTIEPHRHETDETDVAAEGAPTGRVVPINNVEGATQRLEYLWSDARCQTRVNEDQHPIVELAGGVPVEKVGEP